MSILFFLTHNGNILSRKLISLFLRFIKECGIVCGQSLSTSTVHMPWIKINLSAHFGGQGLLWQAYHKGRPKRQPLLKEGRTALWSSLPPCSPLLVKECASLQEREKERDFAPRPTSPFREHTQSAFAPNHILTGKSGMEGRGRIWRGSGKKRKGRDGEEEDGKGREERGWKGTRGEGP